MIEDNETGSAIIKAMIKGFGPEFPSLSELFSVAISDEEFQRLSSPTPHSGRYGKSNVFMGDVTSDVAVGLTRFRVITEYPIALSEELEKYKGKSPKIIRPLTLEEKDWFREVGITLREIKMAQIIEGFSEHDTAAAGDFVKLRVAHLHPKLADYIEAVQLMETSEDTMSIVFGLIANRLFYRHFMTRLIDFCLSRIEFARKFSYIMPALTHEQAAEPFTIEHKFAVPLTAISNLMNELVDENGDFKPFSAKLNGAVGMYNTFYAAYPEIDWPEFSRKFIEERFGLYCEQFTNQCTTFAREGFIFSVACNMISQVVKLTKDFIRSARCPAQFFIKKKKAGQKGSSIMPSKSNAWAMEGGIVVLEETKNLLNFFSEKLQDYPDEGNMARSILFRSIGRYFMPAFTGLDRIQREMDGYIINKDNIQEFFNRYPGMSASSIQTVLKINGVMGDAYRMIQVIAINPDGSYAKAKEFRSGLEEKMEELELPGELRSHLRSLLVPENIVKRGQERAKDQLTNLEIKFKEHRERALRVRV